MSRLISDVMVDPPVAANFLPDTPSEIGEEIFHCITLGYLLFLD